MARRKKKAPNKEGSHKRGEDKERQKRHPKSRKTTRGRVKMAKNADKISSQKAVYEESVQQGKMSLLMKEMEDIALGETKKVWTEKLTRSEKRALHEEKLVSIRKRRLAKLGASGEARRLAKVERKKARKMERAKKQIKRAKEQMEKKAREKREQVMEERNRRRIEKAKARAMAKERASRFMSGRANNSQSAHMDIDGVTGANMLESRTRKERIENRNKASSKARARIRTKAKNTSRHTSVDTSAKD